MEMTKVERAADVPHPLKRAAKVAFAVGAGVFLNAGSEHICAKFQDSDNYYFDPENVTMHALEALGAARTFGLVVPNIQKQQETETTTTDVLVGWLRQPLVIRTVFSSGDVRVQIGASPWFKDEHLNTPSALRAALCDALCAYYDEVIAPAQA